jgi:tRNA pseudouridine55 synthase
LMDGIINFLKPPGMSSSGAVVLLRKLLNVSKAGHAGTLDPGACGVLPVCVGKATRISAYMMDAKKEYVAEFVFGKRADTGDSYGKVTAISSEGLPEEKDVIRALESFHGRITQQTPAYSAVKVAGKKRYELARKGAELPPQSREVEIFEIEYFGRTGPDAHRFRVLCGKGTYIRALCEDIGALLGQCSYMSFLARTKCAGLDIETAVTVDELERSGANALLPMDPFLQALPRADAPAAQREQLFHGGSVQIEAPDLQKARIYAGGGLLGIGSVLDGVAKIHTRLVDD